MNANDKVYLVRFNGHDLSYAVATITRVLPSGAFDAQLGTAEPMRFRANGNRQSPNYRDWELDLTPFHEREALIAKEQATRVAANFLGAITVKMGISSRWGKDGLLTEVVRLEALVAEARAKVEAL